MKNLIPIILLAGLVLSGCGPRCDSFESFNNGDKFKVTDVATTPNLSFTVERFQWSNGTWTSNGHVIIDNNNYANGNGTLDVRANNATLSFQHDFPASEIKLNFGEYGGNNNITVNGVFQNIGNLNSINGTTVGGVQIIVNATSTVGGWVGELVLTGKVKDFSLGGQELWIDDYCYSTR